MKKIIKNIIAFSFLFAFSMSSIMAQDTICDKIIKVITFTDSVHIDVNHPTDTETSDNDSPPVPPNANDPERVVFWVHGMKGDEGSWASAASWASSNYRVESDVFNYSDFQSTLENSIFGVDTKIHDEWLNDKADFPYMIPNFNYVIAHSYGGVVSRGVNEQNDKSVDDWTGLVTFASPHGGSRMAPAVATAYEIGSNSGSPEYDELVAMSTAACEDWAKGPVLEAVNTTFFGGLFDYFGLIETDDIISELCQSGAETASSSIIKTLAPAAVNQLDVGSGDLAINDQIAHKVCFYGSEDGFGENSAYRMFYSGTHPVNNEGLFNAGGQDDNAIDQLEIQSTKYWDKYLLYQAMYNLKPSLAPGWTPACWPYPSLPCMSWNQIKDIRDNYYDGYTRFSKLNSDWEAFTGAQSATSNSEYGDCYEYVEDEYWDGYDEVLVAENVTQSECSALGLDTYWTPYIIVNSSDYDGFLTEESTTAWSAPFHVELIGSNHLQIRNDGNTQEKLQELFENDEYKWFNISKR